jgi:hypothetical protein
VLFVLFGMVWGIQMAISQDHSAFPAHAHNNLLGFVSLFLFGIYYCLHPTLEQNRAARVQVWVWIIATAILDVGVGMVHTGHPNGDGTTRGEIDYVASNRSIDPSRFHTA